MSYAVGYGGPDRARLVLIIAAPTSQVPFEAGVEYYAFRLLLSQENSVGAGACGGCDAPVCIVMNQLTIGQPAGMGDYVLQSAADRNYVTWQGGDIGGAGCPIATPARNRTWGAIKSLYR